MAESFSRLVVRETFWKSLATLTTKAGALVFVVLLARFLQPAGFGLYNLGLSIILTLTILTDAGLNNSVLRYIAYSLGQKNQHRAAAYFQYFVSLKLMLTFSIAIFLALLAYPLSNFIFHKPELFFPLLILAFYLIVLSFENFFEYILYSVNRVKLIFVKEVIFQISRISLALLVFVALTSKAPRLMGILFALIVSQTIALIIIIFALSKSYAFLFKRSKLQIDKKRIFNFLKYSAVGGLSAMFFAYVDIIMLGIFLPSEYVGYYSAAVSLVGALIALMSISNILIPVFSKLPRAQFPGAFNQVFRYLCILALPITFGAFLLGKYLIRFLYGYSYLPTVLPFYFLLFLIFGNILVDIFVAMFSAVEKPKYFVKRLVLFAGLNIILNFILITSLLNFSLVWAMTGAAISTLISRTLYMFSLSLSAKKILKIKFKFFLIIKPLFAALIMFLSLWMMNYFLFSNMTILIGVFEVIAGAVLYFLILFFIRGISRRDLILFHSFLDRK